MRLIEFITAITILAIMPGPDILFVITQSLNVGWKRTMYVISGLMTGLIIYTFLVSFGAGEVIAKYPMVLTILKYFSVLYLLYLGVTGVVKNKKVAIGEMTIRDDKKLNLYLKGVIMNLINPKIMFFFLALFTPFLSGVQSSARNEMIFLGLIMTVISFTIFSFAAFFSSKLKTLLTKGSDKFIPYVSLVIYLLISALILFK